MNGSVVKEMRAAFVLPQLLKINGVERVYVQGDGGGWVEDEMPVPDATPPVLELNTLTGLIDYVRANRDQLPLGDCIIHVEDETTVEVCSRLSTDMFKRRVCYARASADEVLGQGLTFGKFYDLESMKIALLALFVKGEEQQRALNLLSSVRDEDVREYGDSGAAQNVTARAGVHLGEDMRVKNPFTLAPYRTFRELEQPASPFVLRLQKGDEQPKVALFEADGGQWKLTAIERTKVFLYRNLPPESAEKEDTPIVAVLA